MVYIGHKRAGDLLSAEVLTLNKQVNFKKEHKAPRKDSLHKGALQNHNRVGIGKGHWNFQPKGKLEIPKPEGW